ncbi:MAG: hypothetical protein KBC84_02230, partial [Proteobacteria bacterium]|nr:hypothetical protein [Pseudomonadota bacterium]
TVIRVVVSSLLSIAVVLNFKSYDGAFINGLNLLFLSSAVGAIIEYGLLKRSLLKMIEYRFDKSNYIYLVYLNAIISLLIAALWSHLNYFAIPGVLLHITTLVIYAIVYFSCSFLILGKGNVYLK